MLTELSKYAYSAHCLCTYFVLQTNLLYFNLPCNINEFIAGVLKCGLSFTLYLGNNTIIYYTNE